MCRYSYIMQTMNLHTSIWGGVQKQAEQLDTSPLDSSELTSVSTCCSNSRGVVASVPCRWALFYRGIVQWITTEQYCSKANSCQAAMTKPHGLFVHELQVKVPENINNFSVLTDQNETHLLWYIMYSEKIFLRGLSYAGLQESVRLPNATRGNLNSISKLNVGSKTIFVHTWVTHMQRPACVSPLNSCKNVSFGFSQTGQDLTLS